MEKQNSSQLELFSRSEDYSLAKSSLRSRSFVRFIWNYEKAILIIIAMVITGIISFSLGVEKGKRLIATGDNLRFDLGFKPKPILSNEAPHQVAIKPKIREDQKPKDLSGGFTIQLASYRAKSYAEKEAQNLKKKGYLTLILPKGNYIILCVGKFPSKEMAQSTLREIRKQYQDCYVRRL